jgi:hypothetical protein
MFEVVVITALNECRPLRFWVTIIDKLYTEIHSLIVLTITPKLKLPTVQNRKPVRINVLCDALITRPGYTTFRYIMLNNLALVLHTPHENS